MCEPSGTIIIGAGVIIIIVDILKVCLNFTAVHGHKLCLNLVSSHLSYKFFSLLLSFESVIMCLHNYAHMYGARDVYV